MQTSYLIKKLVIPLSLATAMMLTLGYFVQWQGLFINLASTFIGILLTIFYVDLVLREHENKRWARVKQEIVSRVEVSANYTISSFRVIFGFGTDIFDKAILSSGDLLQMRPEVIRIAENILIPATPEKIENINQSDWKKLTDSLRSICESADKIVEVFGNRLEPDILSLIMEIQSKTRGMLISYHTWPDIYGVPDEQLPLSKIGSSTISLKHSLNKMAVNDVQIIIITSANILRKL